MALGKMERGAADYGFYSEQRLGLGNSSHPKHPCHYWDTWRESCWHENQGAGSVMGVCTRVAAAAWECRGVAPLGFGH